MLYTYSLWHLTSLAYFIYSWRVFKNIKILKIYITHDFKFLLLDHFKSISSSQNGKLSFNHGSFSRSCIREDSQSTSRGNSFQVSLTTAYFASRFVLYMVLAHLLWEYKTSREFRGNMNNIKDLDQSTYHQLVLNWKFVKLNIYWFDDFYLTWVFR